MELYREYISPTTYVWTGVPSEKKGSMIVHMGYPTKIMNVECVLYLFGDYNFEKIVKNVIYDY